ncbi:hypothetical protein MBLNU230_g1260t1 [Neophaeotheca triangularis]
MDISPISKTWETALRRLADGRYDEGAFSPSERRPQTIRDYDCAGFMGGKGKPDQETDLWMTTDLADEYMRVLMTSLVVDVDEKVCVYPTCVLDSLHRFKGQELLRQIEELMSVGDKLPQPDNLHTFDRLVFLVFDEPSRHYTTMVVWPKEERVVLYDSFYGKRSAGEAEGLIKGWLEAMGNLRGSGKVPQWKYFSGDQGSFQQTNSNDCGAVAAMAARCAVIGEVLRPASGTAFAVTKLARDFRFRIVAEVLANKINPEDSEIPAWLQGS